MCPSITAKVAPTHTRQLVTLQSASKAATAARVPPRRHHVRRRAATSRRHGRQLRIQPILQACARRDKAGRTREQGAPAQRAADGGNQPSPAVCAFRRNRSPPSVGPVSNRTSS
jgi:hypothetical protein